MIEVSDCFRSERNRLMIIKNIINLLLIMSINSYSVAQTLSIAPLYSKDAIPVKAQKEIETLSVGDGYIVLNSTTGCINYFIAGNWYSLCGNCTPQPEVPQIDSISQTGSKTVFYFNKVNDGDTITISNASKKVTSTLSQVEVYLTPKGGKAEVLIRLCNTCGCKDTAISVPVEGFRVSEIETISVGGKNIKTRKYNNARWMCEDFIPENQKVIDKNAPNFITISKDACPAGWKIPSATEWQELFVLFEGNMNELFLPAANDNVSLHLEKGGVLELKSKKWIVKGEYGSYWCSDYNKGKQKLVNISDLGYIMPEEDPSLLAIPLRCVKYEK